MKNKMIVLALLIAVFLSSCTLRICTPTYVISIATGQRQLYSCVDRRVGPALPVITIINPAQQMR